MQSNDISSKVIVGNKSSAKVVVLGDIATGKTALLNQHVEKQPFNPLYKATMGVSYSQKQYHSNNMDLSQEVRQAFGSGQSIDLQFWDIAGNVRFGNATHFYYKNAEAAIVVFDVTRQDTRKVAQIWKNDLIAKKTPGRMIPTFIVATKCDELTEEAWQSIQAAFPGIGIYRTSAKFLTGINELFNDIAKEVITNRVNQALIERVENHCKTHKTDYQFDFNQWSAKRLLTLLRDMQEKQRNANAGSFFQTGVDRELWQRAIVVVKFAFTTALANENSEKYGDKIVLDDYLYQQANDLLTLPSNASVNRSLPPGASQFADIFVKRSAQPLSSDLSRPRA